MIIKKLHSWTVTSAEAIEIQRRLSKSVKILPLKSKISSIAGADVSFKDGYAFGAVFVMTFPSLELIESVVSKVKITFPYVPTLLTFREGPVLCKCLESLKSNPDLVIFDGQGIAHPRAMGLASHLGILLNTPTIGCAKSHLWGKWRMPGNKKGCFSYIEGRTGTAVGAVLRTRERVKPIFISPGHRIDVDGSIAILLKCATKYRIPEPIRMSHKLCTDYKKGSADCI
ncbi:MAG: endonuclease V [Candidatus Omnitrophica bacterium]|nr:endonuclease V [Candidatus Omnitrophota bacterium]